MTAELLETVAEAYRLAYREGRPPTKAVWEALQAQGTYVSRSTAAKYVMQAREHGLLGPAKEREAGI